jgi:hypothetical protein
MTVPNGALFGVRRTERARRLMRIAGVLLRASEFVEASRVALDLPYWAMCLASYRLTHMTLEMAREAGACFSVVDFMSCITIAKRPCYGPLKIKPSYIIVRKYVLN